MSVESICFLNVDNNEVGSDSLGPMLSSYSDSPAVLTLSVKHNKLTTLPPYLMQNVSLNAKFNVYNDITLEFQYNPITTISAKVFRGESFLRAIYCDISGTTAGKVTVPDQFSYEGVNWDPIMGGLVRFDASNSQIPLGTLVRAFTAKKNIPKATELYLRWNNYTSILNGSCLNSSLTLLDVSYNRISYVSPTAFAYNFPLQTLYLNNNALTVLSGPVINSIPGLSTVYMSDNKVWALPLTNNNIASVQGMEGNVIECKSYGPTLTGCRCKLGMIYSEQCGYGRCMSTKNGCNSSALFNSSGCTNAPSSQCLVSCQADYYYNTEACDCLSQTNCSTKFRDPNRGFSNAYEVYNATLTSDRACSICSACPSGYKVKACTATSNAECIQSSSLSKGDVASIILTVLMLVISSVLGVIYGRSQSRKHRMTRGELEMSEMLLGDVTEQKIKITKEKERMQQAWLIDETDLQYSDVIGRGGNGTVYSGTWGHIPVAVKVLKRLLDDMNPLLTEEFDREVQFMQSIRHPNLLTFYGAGINTKKQAYLVTELMEEGSLWKMLMDKRRTLGWSQRLSFTKDIAQGMRYLHSQNTLHRDLKADNCFVDTQLRVKVADFGTGKIQSAVEDSAMKRRHSFGYLGGEDLTLTKGTGSPLWMAPEILRGDKVSESNGKSTDVFSFGIVMFEIWSRSRPWEEIDEYSGMKFLAKLVDLVCDGHRPQLPSAPVPWGFPELMEECWRTESEERPTFGSVIEALQQILKKEYLSAKDVTRNTIDRSIVAPPLFTPSLPSQSDF